ncbi:MAG: HlyD family type I secretion periplasmic adaptor subunit [Nitrospirales bacterium]
MRWPNLARHLSVWRAAWQDRHQLASRPAFTGPEVEFLPAVLEIQETPPSPVGRAIGATILGVCGAGLLWAGFGEIDIVAVASGKIIPSGRSKVIQPLESGVVRAIHVRDGQEVRQGEVLVELDPTMTGADERRLANEYRSAQVDAARLRALIAGQRELHAPDGADPTFVSLQRQVLQEQLAEQHARVQVSRQQIGQRRAALEATKAMIVRLEATVPMLEERAAAYKRLVEQNYVSRVEYLGAEKQRVEETQELARQREILAQDRAALVEAEQHYEILQAEFLQGRQAELAALETKLASLAQEVIKAEQRQGLQRLTAPIDGVVQQLAINTVGGVVTPAQQLMVVVPGEHRLEIEAWVENKDVGFLRAGQPVEIKVESFPFTRFGLIDGELIHVSRDAVSLENAGLVYAARVSMSRSTMMVEGTQVNLTPGMAVSVEIKTGTRRLIEFFLSPLLRGLHETARER